MPCAVAAQSSHLALLELSAPAVSTDPVAEAAIPGWASAWQVPAAAGGVRGVVLGYQNTSFSSVSTIYALARFRIGALWQVGLAETQVNDLFDPDLLAQYPDLATLHVSAAQAVADVVTPSVFRVLTVSGGVVAERDELLGDARTDVLARMSGRVALPASIRVSVALSRVAVGRNTFAGPGRIVAGISDALQLGRSALTAGLGYADGELWHGSPAGRQFTGTLAIDFANVLRASVAGGFQRPSIGAGGWSHFLAIGLGVNAGTLGADFRYGGPVDGQARPLAFSAEWSAR